MKNDIYMNKVSKENRIILDYNRAKSLQIIDEAISTARRKVFNITEEFDSKSRFFEYDSAFIVSSPKY